MAGDEVLDIRGIDAVLGRFRSRRLERIARDRRATDWEIDGASLLRPEVVEASRLRFHGISERLASEISAVLRAKVALDMRRHEQLRLGRFLKALDPVSCIFSVHVQELKEPAYVVIPAPAATSIIDLLVGGRGVVSPLERGLTAIEQRVIRDLLNPVVAVHERGLAAVQPMSLAWKETFSSAEELRPYPSAATYLVTEYEVRVGTDTVWPIFFALPASELAPALEAAARLPVQTEEKAGERRQLIERRLADARVETRIEIGATELRLADVTALELGDVVVLDAARTQPFTMTIEGVPKYHGRLGRTGKRLAFEISDLATHGATDEDDKK